MHTRSDDTILKPHQDELGDVREQAREARLMAARADDMEEKAILERIALLYELIDREAQ